jgi:uncharacterized membrane protein (DUF485 family)
MKTEHRRAWEHTAIIAGFIGGLFLLAAFTLMMTSAPIMATAVCLPIGFVALVFAILLALYLRRGVAADTWPRSGRNAPR